MNPDLNEQYPRYGTVHGCELNVRVRFERVVMRIETCLLVAETGEPYEKVSTVCDPRLPVPLTSNDVVLHRQRNDDGHLCSSNMTAPVGVLLGREVQRWH